MNNFFWIRIVMSLVCISYSCFLCAIDLEPFDIFENPEYNCDQPCNGFSISYEAYNLTADKIEASTNEVIDYVLVIVRDASCQLVGLHVGEFREGFNNIDFGSTIGGAIVKPESRPVSAFLIDIEGPDELPQDGDYSDLSPFLTYELMDSGEADFLDSPIPIVNCQPHKAKVYSFGQKDVYETGKDLIQTPDEGFLLVGFVGAEESLDVIIKKVNKDREEVWSKTYGGSDREGHDTELDGVGDIEIMQDSDGMYVISTTSSSAIGPENNLPGSPGPSPWIFKINDTGEMIWQTRILEDGGAVFHDLVPNPTGGCFISFSSGNPSYTILTDSIHSVSMFGSIDIAVASIDEAGIVQWVHTVGDEFRNLQSSIDISSDSTLVVLYESESDLGIHVASLDMSGTIHWDRSFGNDRTDGATHISVLADGSYLAATYAFGERPHDVRLIRLNEEGLIWDKQFSMPFSEVIFNLFTEDNGDVLMAGVSDQAVLLMKVDSDGNLLLNQRTILDNVFSFGNIIQLNDGYALTGSIEKDLFFDGLLVFSNNTDLFLTFLDSNAQFIESGESEFSGFIKNRHNIGVPNVNVRLSSGEEVKTDSSGRFQFDEINDFSNLTLNFSKDDDQLPEGLSSVDLVQILNHILGIIPFEHQLQIASADLNNDASVSSVDLIILRNIILGLTNELPNNTPIWRFSENHIPILAIPDSPLQITANKVGDANGDAIK